MLTILTKFGVNNLRFISKVLFSPIDWWISHASNRLHRSLVLGSNTFSWTPYCENKTTRGWKDCQVGCYSAPKTTSKGSNKQLDLIIVERNDFWGMKFCKGKNTKLPTEKTNVKGHKYNGYINTNGIVVGTWRSSFADMMFFSRN